MPTIVDALVVTLGLDPSNFTKGQKTATTAFAKTKEEAVKTGKGIESASDKAAESLEKIARNALKLFAIFTAGRAVKDFTAQITSADAALGRLSQRIGQTPGNISAIANAVGRAGGSVDAAQASMERFSDAMQELKRTGTTGILTDLSRIQALGGKPINLFNKDTLQTQYEIADNLKAISERYGEVTARSYGKAAGFDPDSITLMIQGSAAMKAAAEESRKFGVVTERDTKAAQAFQKSIRGLTQVSEGLGRTIWTNLSPAITDVINRILDWYKANGEWLRTEISEKVKALSDYIKAIDWDGIGKGILAFARGADEAAKSIGGWKVAAEAFFGLWAASKIATLFAPLFAQLALVRLTLLRMGPIGWGLLGLGAIAGALAAADPNKAIVSGGKTPDGNATLNPGDELPGAGPATPRSSAPQGRGGVRGWWDRHAPTWLGGDRDGGAGIRTRARRSQHSTDEGRLNARAPEGAGKYRPEYKLSDADLSQRTADIIAGEAIRHSPESIDAVINNMMNRVGSKGWGPSGNLQEVATAPGQYEAAWKGSKASPSETAFIRERIRAIASGGVPDNTKGSNAYRASSYRGPWYQKHADAPVVGGNRYAYEPGVRNGPYAPYATPKDVSAPPTSSTGRKPEVLADPKDERRQAPTAFPSPQAAVEPASAPRTAATPTPQSVVPDAAPKPQVPAAAPAPKAAAAQKPQAAAEPSIWRGYPQASAFVAQTQAAQAAVASNISNDNRSSVNNVNSETKIGDVHIHTAATDADGIGRDMERSIKQRSFAVAANYGQA